ncbi:PqqD family protein [Ruminococcus sp. HUN007]|uniref:PqqD family protein n=1 Tax=Ruminococcus sp. HUN007 TaxID=1514668 RepID=UPI0005D16F1B|nr:PqqD family protein [Ruminococcus sp. HUN007]
MKLSNKFIAHEDGNEKLLVSTGAAKFSGLVRGNPTAGFIINCLETETTPEEIVAKMAREYDAPRDVLERDALKIIDQLRKIGAIDE